MIFLAKIKYDINLMKIMSMFESLTRSKLKDCFEIESQLIFVVEEGEIGKAIGKKAVNVKKIENSLKRKIKIVEFDADSLEFTKKVVFPLKLKEINEEEGIITMTAADNNTRGLLIGRNAQNLRHFEAIVKRFYDIKELKVT